MIAQYYKAIAYYMVNGARHYVEYLGPEYHAVNQASAWKRAGYTVSSIRRVA